MYFYNVKTVQNLIEIEMIRSIFLHPEAPRFQELLAPRLYRLQNYRKLSTSDNCLSDQPQPDSRKKGRLSRLY